MDSNSEIALNIEDLLIGSGADQFREFERKISQFCPFEAIGMVRQEIRHAHFLSFILDPNRPHPFKDTFLKAFLQEIVFQAQDGQMNLHPLKIHCSDFIGAFVYRERSNIDLMIEVPRGTSGVSDKGLVVAVELKVDAKESKHQLQKYYHQVCSEYSDGDWDRIFVFLTPDAAAPTSKNLNNWIPVGLMQLVERFDQEFEAKGVSGDAATLYRNYSSMIRRNLMRDEELAQIAKKIWAKHGEALEKLYDFRPDLQAEVIEWLDNHSDDLTQKVKDKTGFTLKQDTSSPRIKRYVVEEWKKMAGFCDGDRSWVETGSMMAFELTDWGGGCLRFSIVLGPGNPEIRERIYEEVLRRVDRNEIGIGRRTAKIAKYKHLSATDAQTGSTYAKAEVDLVSAEELGRAASKKIVAFLEKHLNIYDNILRTVLTDGVYS